ncbi:MAG TPA: hypothetical protein VFV33_04830 [Gemmatimonadaceae bacterium]|nr:hypothetical protein [Gemmatimonadaceae bacterium]
MRAEDREHIAAKATVAYRALGELAAALRSVATTPEAHGCVRRAADAWSAAIVQGVAGVGAHPLTARCDVAGCRGCPVCAPSRREVSP